MIGLNRGTPLIRRHQRTRNRHTCSERRRRASRQLALESRIEQGRFADLPLDLELVRIDHTCLGQSGGLAPISLALFQGARLGAGCDAPRFVVVVLTLQGE
jgi:hypothetical protein